MKVFSSVDLVRRHTSTAILKSTETLQTATPSSLAKKTSETCSFLIGQLPCRQEILKGWGIPGIPHVPMKKDMYLIGSHLCCFEVVLGHSSSGLELWVMPGVSRSGATISHSS